MVSQWVLEKADLDGAASPLVTQNPGLCAQQAVAAAAVAVNWSICPVPVHTLLARRDTDTAHLEREENSDTERKATVGSSGGCCTNQHTTYKTEWVGGGGGCLVLSAVDVGDIITHSLTHTHTAVQRY